MNEQDKEIKKIFDGFDPQLNDSDNFLQKLETRMDGVEFLRDSSRSTLRNYRHAILAAAVAGFASGALMALIYPRLVAWTSSISWIADYSGIAAWIIAAAITCVIAFATYTRTLRS